MRVLLALHDLDIEHGILQGGRAAYLHATNARPHGIVAADRHLLIDDVLEVPVAVCFGPHDAGRGVGLWSRGHRD